MFSRPLQLHRKGNDLLLSQPPRRSPALGATLRFTRDCRICQEPRHVDAMLVVSPFGGRAIFST